MRTQRVWRRYRPVKMAALEVRGEWEKVVEQNIQTTELCSMKTCFQILLESIQRRTFVHWQSAPLKREESGVISQGS
ncbi:E3 ubiquitin-protein ligase UPL7-like [Pyrus ussuriensis x Pyrus communis]|uniref:E3 ubiquitin-protein ligase UPL7-like n=1 Tax=Pyrus ussuriensis x Pyrus communis TaxID=2448454 RepID=A0A5N5HVW4_9ROSA|nr:E3 ubiquitin-protein ligase UPL7-like [Pyrus ussuriensis x Pyrus communis]